MVLPISLLPSLFQRCLIHRLFLIHLKFWLFVSTYSLTLLNALFLTASRGPRDIVYSGNLDSAHQDCERRTLLGIFGRMLSGKSFEIEVH